MNHVGMLVGGRFEVESVAGRGGMGAVYRARDRERGGHVALKIVDAAGNRAVRFEREARVLADLEHPAIVRYLAHGRTAAGEPFLAMEWLEGEDLAARLKREPVGARDAVRLVQRAAEALGVAHARGIVHRDIKPSNLFLVGGECARVKVLDFGVAHVQADALTRTGAALGTPSYMAPEQARGERRIDARADVFSLGCVLFECMVGHPPFVGENTMAVLAKILIEDAPRVSSLRGDLPAELDDLIARLVAKDPAVRPRDGRDVAALLGVLGTITDTAVTRARDSAVTVGEQRLACVVLASRAIPLGTDPTATPTGEEATLAEASAPTLADAATPTTGRELANAPRLTALRAAALAHGGTAEVLADGSVVVTIFGRGAATDQAAQGARCALALRALLGDVAMAFAVGRCPVEDRASLGDLLDRAARLLRAPAVATAATALHRAQTGVPPIRVDDTAAGLLDARFAIDGDELGLALVGERDLAAPARTLLGKPMPCVGRERELAALTALFDECIAEPMAHVVVVTAPAGVGKSRLRHELLARIAVRDVEVWMGSGDAMNPGAPFGMLAQALRRAAGIVDGEPPLVRNMKLRARVMRHLAGDDAMRVTEFVGELVGAPVIDDGSMQLRAARRDPQLMGDQTLRACEDLVAAESSARPLLLVLEDLHWGDLPTVRFVDSVMRQLPDRPVMVLAFARPEVDVVFPRLWAERNVQRIGLGELTRRAASKLVRDALGNALDEAAVGRLVDRAAGNAFYLEELIRAVADGKDDLPDTVIAMAQTRIDDLEAEARQVLRAASIFGDTFWQQGVEALLEASAPRVDVWLTELVARELVVEHRESRFAGQRQYGFRHALVREAAYAMLPERDRVRGHLIVGNWLEQRGGEIDAVALAEHFERGGEPARSVAWYRRAAEHALESNDLASAI
ncbi:MAG TPA: protein kinase, partial [Kofleriaceae bacterium]|nr:protein kinase [Kofleriaceae bacterium]